jgi:hypothetical protein
MSTTASTLKSCRYVEIERKFSQRIKAASGVWMIIQRGTIAIAKNRHATSASTAAAELSLRSARFRRGN